MKVQGPVVYTVPEVAQLLKVSSRTVHRMVEAGTLRAVHAGRFIRIPAESLQSYLDGEQPNGRVER